MSDVEKVTEFRTLTLEVSGRFATSKHINKITVERDRYEEDQNRFIFKIEIWGDTEVEAQEKLDELRRTLVAAISG